MKKYIFLFRSTINFLNDFYITHATCELQAQAIFGQWLKDHGKNAHAGSIELYEIRKNLNQSILTLNSK